MNPPYAQFLASVRGGYNFNNLGREGGRNALEQNIFRAYPFPNEKATVTGHRSRKHPKLNSVTDMTKGQCTK